MKDPGTIMSTTDQALSLVRKNVSKRKVVSQMLAVKPVMLSLATLLGEHKEL